MKIKSKDDMKIGVAVWFLPAGKMAPPKGVLDDFAKAKRHLFVCTFYDSKSGASQWLFLTSDPHRADNGCVFTKEDKVGSIHEWDTRDSHFYRNNCVEIATVEEVIDLSKDDSFMMPAFVKEERLKKFGEDVLKK